MLEKPNIADEMIVSSLQLAYGLNIESISFLPLGADTGTAVYRAESHDDSAYFVKLRSTTFAEPVVAVPDLLSNLGIEHLIVPLTTKSGKLWTTRDDLTMMVYPYVEGEDGYQRTLPAHQWPAFGATLFSIHTAQVPARLQALIPEETYSPYWRDQVRLYQQRLKDEELSDPIAIDLSRLMQARHESISLMVQRAEQLGDALRNAPKDYVLCHGDLHPGNLLISTDSDRYAIVDWDTVVFAPREKDLMFFGPGSAEIWRTEAADSLFFQGYGQLNIDPEKLAYYRYERIVQDIAAFCQQILSDDGDEDRKQALRYLSSQFQPDREVDIAVATDTMA